MEMLTMVLAALISFLGLPIGFILAKISKEELEAGKRYFQVMQSAIYALTILFVLSSFNIPINAFIVIAIVIVYLSLKLNPKALISYIVFIPLFLISSKNTNLFILTSSLIFLYGLPTGALIIQRGFKNYMKEEIENPISTGYLSKAMQKIKYIIWVVMLEIISIPTVVMKGKTNAIFHLKFVCPLCPSSRKRHRDVHGNSACWWEYHWERKSYNIPKHFGIMNWIRQYTRFGTNLKKFKKIK